MNYITLIATVHKENGRCNSNELFNIIQCIKPEIIFEELSEEIYNQCYFEQNRTTLESIAIKKYLLKNNIKHIPVDTFDIPNFHYDIFNKMLHVLTSNKDFQLYLDKQIEMEYINGFSFLNSKDNDKRNIIIKTYNEKILENLNDINLKNTYNYWNEFNNNKESTIIKNIYDYTKNNKYSSGLMFIGSAHRKSIIHKINKYKRKEEIKINWKFHDFKKTLQANGT